MLFGRINNRILLYLAELYEGEDFHAPLTPRQRMLF